MINWADVLWQVLLISILLAISIRGVLAIVDSILAVYSHHLDNVEELAIRRYGALLADSRRCLLPWEQKRMLMAVAMDMQSGELKPNINIIVTKYYHELTPTEH
jgi:hypothetical protein